MPDFISPVDPEGLLEFSVVFTDRSLNHMSARFRRIVVEISQTLRQVYHAEALALVPGGGTCGMEAVARQFATSQRCLVIRNGWFSYRWTQILEMGGIPSAQHVLKATRQGTAKHAPFAPPSLELVREAIAREKPDLVFAPHVETASGILLPDDYLRSVAAAVHEAGGLFVLDCVASGTLWVDMAALGVDILLSAPQKGWSGSPGCAFVLLGARALARLPATQSSSFALDLRKWLQIMQAYEAGGHAYHATLPTDALATFHAAMTELAAWGFETSAKAQRDLGQRARQLLAQKGFASVAAPGFEAPGVIVCHTDDDGIHKGAAFARVGLQTAAGVPLMCDEGADFKTFRIGLFGLDKLKHPDWALANLEQALEKL